MLCRYLAWNVLIGAAVALALAELVYPPDARDKQLTATDDIEPDKPRDIPAESLDSDAWEVDISGGIPEWLRAEPAEAERVVRSRR